MLDGVINLLIDHLLVDLGVIVTAKGLAVGGGQAHHAISQDRHLLVRLGVLAVGHFAHRRLLGGALLVITGGATHDCRSRSRCGTQSQRLEKRAATQGFAALVAVMIIIVHHT